MADANMRVHGFVQCKMNFKSELNKITDEAGPSFKGWVTVLDNIVCQLDTI